ncbi:MAG: methionyl-tRNA formyltransferase [Fimbriimonadaceae bacterium]|nr:methionyl-tRNA formyltransferase [Fimbriimonadaceae bacterium]
MYFGTGTFAIPPLKAIADQVVLVVTQPDRPTGRGMRLHPSPVRLAALELGLPVATPERVRSAEFVEMVEALKPDALVVASYGQILSQRLLDSAIRGGINLHGSLLPKYRGAAPIQRCIFNGDRETGVTLMQMDRGMDSGDIIDIVEAPIGPDETYGELQDRLAAISADMIVDWLPRIIAGDYPRTTQDHASMTLAPKVERAECEIQFNRNASDEYNRLRAFSPSPGCFVRSSSGHLRIISARLGSGTGTPGVVISTRDGFEVGFGEGSLCLLEVQPEGKKKMSGRDFANGMRLKPGSSLI